MLKYNLASRFIFAGIGLLIVLSLPKLVGNEVAAQYYTFIMALNLFSGSFSLSYRQQLYINISNTERMPLVRKGYLSTTMEISLIFTLLLACTLIMPHVVPSIESLQSEFLMGLIAAYLISFSYVSFWISGKLYAAYAVDSILPIIMFLSFMLYYETNFILGVILATLMALCAFSITSLHHWCILKWHKNTLSTKVLSQLIALSSFAEILFFSNIESSADIVNYRISLAIVTLVGIIFGVLRQWEIFQNTVVNNRERSRNILVIAPAITFIAIISYALYPIALFVILPLVAMLQLISASDQFLIIRANRSRWLIVGYAFVLCLMFFLGWMLGIADIHALLLFKIILIISTTLVPAYIAYFFLLRII